MKNPGKSISRSLTLWKGRLRGLLSNPPSHETIRSEVQLAVDDGNVQVVGGLEVGDQTGFLEIVDQVSAHDSSLRDRL